ncbi:MAG TPA: hypothetical protein VEL47_04040 [Myxococcota bacterium]|nr:hypothetical protein [Myxococcota bacterium]
MRFIQLVLMSILLCSSLDASSHDLGIGDEYIAPLRYPRALIGADYMINRRFHGFADSALRTPLKNQFSGSLAFEAGLVKYFNAGAFFAGNVSNMIKAEPLFMRMGVFAKPYIGLGERVSIFSRCAAGLAWGAFGNYAAHLLGLYPEMKDEVDRVYKGQAYSSGPYGFFGQASIGIEYFPFSRVGLALEFGVRASLYRASRNILLQEKVEDVPGAPSAFNFMVYELPAGLTLQIIL